MATFPPRPLNLRRPPCRSEQAVDGSLASQLQCVTVMIREKVTYTEKPLSQSDDEKPSFTRNSTPITSGGGEVAVGAQTADDVICNCGPPVSRENCSDSQHVAE
ncbi:hypothetical protein JOB18_037832 [Solea senegalensis]|uniref:Uncharacterized protein n=1 Tax=Solea senegalensis TaxID=28829 RepID=A0AAV6S3L1_SOLSE|nr:hypothetical protein JOB18_037832 [Solea senegalensis]